MDSTYNSDKCALHNLKTNNNILFDRSFLHCVHGLNYKMTLENIKYPENIYPFCNTYYSHSEDVDAVSRVPHYQDVIKSNNIQLNQLRNTTERKDFEWYTEKNAHLKYLRKPPIGFIILGKPDIGEDQLASELAEYWKCVHINPLILIEDDINNATQSGICIEFNLRSGRNVDADIILRLLKRRLNSPEVLHRGFVINGFPLVGNDLIPEELNEDISQLSESNIFTVDEIFDPHMQQSILEQIGLIKQEPVQKATSEDLSNVQATTSNIKYEIPGTTYEDQVNILFESRNFSYVIIYLKCCNEDVVNKRNANRWDDKTAQVINYQHFAPDRVHTMYDRNLSVGMKYFSYKPEITHDWDNAKLFKLQKDLPANVNSQLEKYRLEILPAVEKFVLTIDPQYFVRLDARSISHHMFTALKSRLHVLPISEAIIPQKLIDDIDQSYVGENEPPPTTTYQTMNAEEVYKDLRRKKIISSIYKWTLSNWGYLCPVSMTQNVHINGSPNFAVGFINKIYFLADEDAMNKFIANPRPYLLPPYPRMYCKVIVMGPPKSGKTSIAECISYMLDATLLDSNSIIEQVIEVLRKEYIDGVKASALNEGIDLFKEVLKAEYNEREINRLNDIEYFLSDMKTKIKRRIECVELLADFHNIEFTSFALPMQRTKPADILEAENDLNLITKFLENINFPLTEDITYYETILDDDEFLRKFIPSDLLQGEEFDATCTTGRKRYIETHIAEAVKKAEAQFNITYADSLNVKEVANSFRTTFKLIENVKDTSANGWVLDGIPYNIDVFTHLYPNYVPNLIYILKDDKEHQFLKSRYLNKQSHKMENFKEFFTDIGNIEASNRAPQFNYTEEDLRFISKIVSSLIDNVFILTDEDVFPAQHSSSSLISNREFLYFQEELKTYDEFVNSALEFFNKNNIPHNFISITNKSMKTLLLEIVHEIQNKFNLSATSLTPEDLLEERQDFGAKINVRDEEELGEDEDIVDDVDEREELFQSNRRFGDTNTYCPVAFRKYGVLWKGKERYGVKFEDELYFCYSELAKDEFIANPTMHLARNKLPKVFPPPRIFVCGFRGSGKTTLSIAVAKNMGLVYINFDHLLREKVESQIVKNYFENNEPLNEHLNNILIPLWQDEPIKSIGFVLDDFPKRQSDMETMVSLCAIPDLILQLSISVNILDNRLYESLMRQWHIQMAADQEQKQLKINAIKVQWEEDKVKRKDELRDLMREERYLAKLEEREDDTENLRTRSQISYASIDEAYDMAKINTILDNEFPEPKFDYEWETEEQAMIRLRDAVTDTYESDQINLTTLKDLCEIEYIPWKIIDANLDIQRVYNQSIRHILPIYDRNQSLFERTYDVTLDVAERLLRHGYYLLSDFGRSCPVQTHEKMLLLQMKETLEQNIHIYPIIHKRYIYFIAGKDNRKKFKHDPIKYLNSDCLKFVLIPFRFSVIGPPKCGKTTLSTRISFEYGMQAVSIGKAVRYVLKYVNPSCLATEVEHVLRVGDELSDELTMACVEAISYSPKCIAYGMIMDGFPNNLYEVRELAKYNMIPHLILDLKANESNIKVCMELQKPHYNFYYSEAFINYRYTEWLLTAVEFRRWIDDEYQNKVLLSSEFSACHMRKHANDLISAAVFEIQHYYKHIGEDIALRVGNMLVTPLEFLTRQSRFKQYCLVCLHYYNEFIYGGMPPDRQGLVQYKEKFYWLCNIHIEEFINNPLSFLPPRCKHSLPEDLPYKCRLLKDIPNSYLYMNGYCIVCYVEHLPNIKKRKGIRAYGAEYSTKYYLFDTSECQDKFLRRPGKYVYADTVGLDSGEPTFQISKMPTLGFLEQYCGDLLVKALIDTSNLRPMAPFLTMEQSALINIALFLKINNPRTPKQYIPLYEKAKEDLANQPKLLLEKFTALKQTINPYVYYEEPIPKPGYDISQRSKFESTESTVSSRSIEPSLSSFLNS